MSPKQRGLLIAVFATAMGYLEAAVVFYLRTMVNRLEPHQADPLPDVPALALPEMAREFATLVMLISAGWLAGRTWRGRVGFSLMAFGIWDITYYLFLPPLTHWPRSMLDWDVLFLIPLPWWGPVAAPMSIAGLMILFGWLATCLELGEPPIWPGRLASAVCGAGIVLALLIFMSDALAAAAHGAGAIRAVLPEKFNWPAFCSAWLMMGAPVAQMGWQLATRYR